MKLKFINVDCIMIYTDRCDTTKLNSQNITEVHLHNSFFE